jgi:hypothetical protein
LVTDGVYQGKTGVWTDNVVYPEVLDLGDWSDKSINFLSKHVIPF